MTTKDEIIAELGSPRSELLLERGSLLVYDASGDTEWFCAAGAPGPGLAGGGGTFGVSYRYLLRVFLSDENTVAWTEVTRVKSKRFSISKDCPAAGLCYDRGGWMFLASRSSERGIKESTVPFDLCAIFIYSDAKSYVTIDDIPGSVLLNEESFVHRLVSPGVHRVSRHKTEFEFECEAGRPYFLRVESEDGMRLVDTDIGRDETRDRRLILNARDPWTEDRAIQQDTAF